MKGVKQSNSNVGMNVNGAGQLIKPLTTVKEVSAEDESMAMVNPGANNSGTQFSLSSGMINDLAKVNLAEVPNA
jgi:hypothetical protein